MKISVLFAPYSDVALVKDADQIEVLPCWAVSPSWDTREESAPHMFNTHADPLREEVEMDDEHPFPKVLDEITKRVNSLRESIDH